MKYLDLNGLNIFWGKIRTEITTKVEDSVKNEMGDSETDAISQKTFTETAKAWNQLEW